MIYNRINTCGGDGWTSRHMTKVLGGTLMSKIISGIYEIRNTINGHRYVGSAVNIQQRWIDHRKRLRRGNHHCKHLQYAWNKYGESAFVFSILRYVNSKEYLISNEQEFIDRLNPEYNTARFAGSTLGFKQPPHVGKAVGEANSKRQHSDETRRKLATNKGKKFTAEHVKKIMLGRILYYLRGGKNGNERMIRQFSMDGKFIAEYQSVSEAAKKTGAKDTHISRCARGKRKSTRGFIWRYANKKRGE